MKSSKQITTLQAFYGIAILPLRYFLVFYAVFFSIGNPLQAILLVLLAIFFQMEWKQLLDRVG